MIASLTKSHLALSWVCRIVAAAILGAAFYLSLSRADMSRIIIYNNTGETIDELTVTACGQHGTFRTVESGASVRFRLAPDGKESEIAILIHGATLWKGDFIEPRGGYCAIIRINRDGEIVCHTRVSAWN